MATHLRIHSLTVATTHSQQTFTFDSPLTVITGPTAIGKSTLLMLIKYALGGTATLTDAVRQYVTHVDVTVTIADTTMTLRRQLSADKQLRQISDDPTAPGQKWPVTSRDPHAVTAAQHLMTHLPIPAHPFAVPRRGDSEQTATLTFDDVFRYCYLQARDIDRAIVGHLDKSVRNPTRIALFERMFRITDPELEQLRLQRGAVRTEARRLAADIVAISRFIGSSRVGSDQELTARHVKVSLLLDDVEQQLREARTNAAAATATENLHRKRLVAARNSAAQYRGQLTDREATVRARTAALAQLRIDLAKTERMTTAAAVLAPFEFVTCPRCAQTLDGRTPDSTDCLLCCQPLPAIDVTDTTAADKDIARLRDQIDEAQKLLDSDVLALEQVRAAAAHSEDTLDLLLHAYDDATRAATNPLLEYIAELSGRAEALRSELDAIDRDRSQRQDLADLQERHEELRRHENALKNDIDLATTAQQHSSQGRLSDLSAAFAAEVVQLGIPADGPARIDPVTYLPMIGDTDFENLQASGGGAATALTIAYHLTLLTFALDHPDVLLPDLLIIDSPRKAMSNSDTDQQLGRRIYDRFTTLANAYRDRLQIIVADTDVPAAYTTSAAVIELTSTNTTVPGIVNTGVGRGTTAA